jgi:hypothetical protein
VDFRKTTPSYFSSAKVPVRYRNFYGQEKLKRRINIVHDPPIPELDGTG